LIYKYKIIKENGLQILSGVRWTNG